VSVQHLLDIRLADRANFLLHYFATLEHQQRRNAANLVAARYLNVRVYIYFADLYPAGVLGGDLIDRRAHHSAGAAPLRPEVNQNRLRRIQHFLIEASVCKN